MPTYRVCDIEWDIDEEGDDLDLPKEMIIRLENDLDTEALEEALSDAVSEKTGFCHRGFRAEPISDEPHLEP